MPQKITTPTDEQMALINAYCQQHDIKPAVAGRIAWARLLAKPPKRSEIKAATLERGRPDIAEWNRERAGNNEPNG